MLDIQIFRKIWPIRGEFRLSRGARTAVETLQMIVSDGVTVGRAEAVPYARYNENLDNVTAQIAAVLAELRHNPDPIELINLLPAGAARNLCDLALWDYRAKAVHQSVWTMAGIPEPAAVMTAYTLSLDTPDAMAEKAAAAAAYPLLKLKLGTPDDAARLRAIKAARPDARLIVDANEGWTIDQLHALSPIMAECGVVLCEQPLPAAADAALEGTNWPFILCADESIHTATDIPRLAGRYGAVNIKLDKTGGLTAALEAIRAARQYRMEVMVGCMLASSLAMAPAVLLAQLADWVDLDGPLLLAEDYVPRLNYDAAQLYPPQPALWG